ncbi:HPr family phosphocarrier protein [Desulfitobacterium sp. AusDCA]|uniref:HPr family phosphocarrier protein n=1 Tax=Desulfitobacterium sp. AusDCA TaxID=3240383 RepID=UPI003DA71934
MLTQQLVLQNRGGLHARPATFLVQITNKYQSKIKVILDGKEADGKSVIGLMTLGAGQGKEITLVVDGMDEQETMADIVAFLQKNEE